VQVIVDGNKVWEGSMFGSKKTKGQPVKKAVCELCGLDCQDKESLQRHLDWAHKDQKDPSIPQS
jgi:hypothetical protein